MKLKNCPFCGGKAKFGLESLDERSGYADVASISCTNCFVRKSKMGDTSRGGYADNSKIEREVIKAWNTRVTE